MTKLIERLHNQRSMTEKHSMSLCQVPSCLVLVLYEVCAQRLCVCLCVCVCVCVFFSVCAVTYVRAAVSV